MGLPRLISTTLALAFLAAACSGSSTSTGGPTSPAQSSPGGRPIPSFGIPGTSLEAAAEHDEQVWANAMRESGAAEALGPKLLAWVDERRHAFVAAVLAKNGIQAGGEVASADPRFGIERQTALGGGGLTLALTGGFLGHFTKGMRPERDSGEFSYADTDTKETEVDGHKATTKMTIGVDFHFSGSTVDGTVDITSTTTVFGPDGTPIGTITFVTKATVDMDVCPDIDGGLNAHFDTENDVTVTGSIKNAGASYHLTTTGVATGEVGEDALLQAIHVTGEAGQRTSGNTGLHAFDAAVRLEFRGALATPGQVGSLTIQESGFSEDVTRIDDSTTSDDLTKLDVEVVATGNIIASLLFEAAQEKWRGGYCVHIEATEQTRIVDPDETVPFSARVFHNFDGVELDKPIVATLNGVKSATPLDIPQDPPANITYTAGPTEKDAGTVTLKSTSNRGIGELGLTFTVAPELVMQFEMDSEIKITKTLGIEGWAGTAQVSGTILLEKDSTGHWSGKGLLQTKMVPGLGGCGAVIIFGAREPYDWWIRDVVARPGGTTIDLSMENDPTTNETPDTTVFRPCPAADISGVTNTWENAFFVAHAGDRGALGMHVTGWTITATDATWITGGLVAEATWTENCAGPTVAPGASAAPGPTAIPRAAILGCTGTTHMRLRLVTPPIP